MTGSGGCWRSPAAARAPSPPVASPRRPRSTPMPSWCSLRPPRSMAAATDRAAADAGADAVVVLIPAAEVDAGRRVSAAILRELESGLAGFSFALGRSRRVENPLDLQRAYDEALLALNVAEGDAERTELAYEETGT